MNDDFTPAERAALYRVIALRRDVRSEFLSDPIGEDVLARVLEAAHQAPSVGLSQPWRFIIVRDIATRRSVHEAFMRANAQAAEAYDVATAPRYRTLKLAGILAAPGQRMRDVRRRPEAWQRVGTAHDARDRTVFNRLRDPKSVACGARRGTRRRLGQHPGAGRASRAT